LGLKAALTNHFGMQQTKITGQDFMVAFTSTILVL
jgi:hypothetical protein